jgi:hypothetical protein
MLGRKFSSFTKDSRADKVPSLQEVFGGNAVSDEYGIGRHVANLFVTQTYEGQSDIHGMSSASLCYCSADHATSSDSRESNHWNPGLLLSS